MRIFSVSDDYVDYLKSDVVLNNILDNKEGRRTHTRKYIGAVFLCEGYDYFIPFSSPKESDYVKNSAGIISIRKSIIPIIRMVTADTHSGSIELLGTLKLSSMIPVPRQELNEYNLSIELDIKYKELVVREFRFIKDNEDKILKYAATLYNQKLNEQNHPNEKYLQSTVNFKYAEKKCLEYCKTNNITPT